MGGHASAQRPSAQRCRPAAHAKDAGHSVPTGTHEPSSQRSGRAVGHAGTAAHAEALAAQPPSAQLAWSVEHASAAQEAGFDAQPAGAPLASVHGTYDVSGHDRGSHWLPDERQTPSTQRSGAPAAQLQSSSSDDSDKERAQVRLSSAAPSERVVESIVVVNAQF